MTIALSASEFGAIRVQDEHRNRKSSNTKREQAKPRNSNVHMQNDFPYRYVFPANHPYSSFTQFLSPPPAATPYNNQNSNYDPYPPSSSHQQYSPGQPEYKYLMKPQSTYQVQPTYQTNTQPFSPSLPMTPLPFHSPSAPMILLVHAGHAGTGTGTGGPFQTFVLIPADGSQSMSSLPMNSLGLASHQSYAGGSIPTLQLPSAPSYNNVGVPPAPNVLPITPASIQQPILFRPTSFAKPANSHFHSLLQRPINVYPMPNGKYYPQKKNSLEPRMSPSEKDTTRRMTTSTEGNLGKHDSDSDNDSFT